MSQGDHTSVGQHQRPEEQERKQQHDEKKKREAVPSTPLSVFFLPPELVSSLVPQAQTADAPVLEPSFDGGAERRGNHHRHHQGSETTAVATSLDSTVPSCRVCEISQFESVAKQREHVKLDWHRYNLKQQLLDKSARPITEHQFENMMQDLSSISGSDTESDSNSSDEDARSGITSRKMTKTTAQTSADTGTGDDQEALIQSLMKKLELTVKENQRARHQDPVLVHQQQLLEQQLHEARASPMIWFTSPLYEETVRLGIYKNALPNKGQSAESVVEHLQSLQFHVPPVVKKQKNNKARREARRAAAAGTSGEQGSTSGEQQRPSQDGVNSAEPDCATQPDTDVPSTASKSLDRVEEASEDKGDDEDDDEDDYEPEWVKYQRAKQLQQGQGSSTPKPANQARYWTLIMIGGGHFAGLVVDLAGQVSSHGRDMKVVAHKTFHRYTVRKKQGGSQAVHGSANSAGARVRMYNEEALKLEVRELLESWSHWIKQSEAVFVHSPGGNNRRVLFYDDSIISAADRQGRLRSIPFMTRRPTLSELKRAFQELTTVKVSVLSRASLERKELAEQEALERALEASQSKSAKEQEAAKRAQFEATAATLPEAPAELVKLIELVKKGRVEAMSNHILKHGMDVSQLLPLSASTEYDIRRTPTLLHLASHHGQAQVVKGLLEKHYADPTTTTASAANATSEESEQDPAQDGDATVMGASSFTAYDIAKDKETRNAFRRAMALLPDAWDWVGQAHVPSALTPEMEAEQERKAKEKTRKLLDAERERKKTREASRPTTPVGGATATKSSSASSPSGSSSLMAKNLASVSAANSHLSPEMRMRLERERRANAAEARMATMKQAETVRKAVQDGKNVCVACGKSLDGLTPFDKFGRKFCTTDCVAKGPA